MNAAIISFPTRTALTEDRAKALLYEYVSISSKADCSIRKQHYSFWKKTVISIVQFASQQTSKPNSQAISILMEFSQLSTLEERDRKPAYVIWSHRLNRYLKSQ